MFQDLENTLIEIKNVLKLYRELFALQLDNLRTRQQVAKFLKVNQKTVYNWTKDGTFHEGIHFLIDKNGKKEYIPNGIIQFEEEMKMREVQAKMDKIKSDIESRMKGSQVVVIPTNKPYN